MSNYVTHLECSYSQKKYVKNILNINNTSYKQEIKSGSIELKNLNFSYKKNYLILNSFKLVKRALISPPLFIMIELNSSL